MGIKNLRLNRKLLVHTTRPVVETDGQALLMQGMDIGIMEFKTLLVEEAEEISQKMIA